MSPVHEFSTSMLQVFSAPARHSDRYLRNMNLGLGRWFGAYVKVRKPSRSMNCAELNAVGRFQTNAHMKFTDMGEEQRPNDRLC